MSLKYRLEITNIEEYERTKEFVHCTDVECFFTLADVWAYLGGRKLKKYRCGWIGKDSENYYTLVRI